MFTCPSRLLINNPMRDRPNVDKHTTNNRYKFPTPNGWRDVSVYVSFPDTACKDVVCEIQFT